MFGIGMPELIVVLVVALLVLGPRRLPEVARSLGRGMAEFRRASTELRNTLNEPVAPPEEPKQPGADAAEKSETTGPTSPAPEKKATAAGVQADEPADEPKDG